MTARRPSAALAAAAGAIALAVAATAGLLLARPERWALDAPWAPAWGARLSFEVDGLGALYGLLAAGIGVLVFAYAAAAVPRHLAHAGRPAREAARFHGAMALFLVAMVGLVTARDMLVLFVCWDLTAIASYLLVATDRHDREARRAALMAFLVTAVTAVPLLIALLILRQEAGSFSLPDALAAAEPGTEATVAGALVVVAALAKAAQVPLHFWLPRAMAAPTPASAYLHSAAMVAAGVFLLSRFHPLLVLSPGLLDALLVVGFASIAIGGVLALCEAKLKRILAYSTISQYGYVVVALGVGGEKGAAAACLYVVSHGIAKSALFMTAGTVSEATGQDRIDACGGLGGSMPWVAAASGVCAAAVAGLPLTLGFFADELYYGAAAQRGTLVAALAVAGAGLTFAYMARFWTGVFLGRRRTEVRAVPVLMVAPIVVLAALLLATGLEPSPLTALAEPAAGDTHAAPAPVDAAYHLDARAENVMALAAVALGILLALAPAVREPAAAALSRLGRRLGPERAYTAGLHGLNRLSDAIHDLEVRDLRGRVAAVLVPGWVLVLGGIASVPGDRLIAPGAVRGEDLPLAIALLVVAGAAVAVARPRRHITLMLSLSAVGFGLALVYGLMGAPDVALVAVLIETVFALLFLGAFALLPAEDLRREARLEIPRRRVRRDALFGLGSGLIAAVVVLSALARETPEDSMAQRQIEATPSAHGKDVVTVILADFRALDTMVEITVIGVALLGIVLLLRREQPR